MTDFRALISLLVNSSVEFIIVGGAAATAHGSSRLTEDLRVRVPALARKRLAPG